MSAFANKSGPDDRSRPTRHPKKAFALEFIRATSMPIAAANRMKGEQAG